MLPPSTLPRSYRVHAFDSDDEEETTQTTTSGEIQTNSALSPRPNKTDNAVPASTQTKNSEASGMERTTEHYLSPQSYNNHSNSLSPSYQLPSYENLAARLREAAASAASLHRDAADLGYTQRERMQHALHQAPAAPNVVAAQQQSSRVASSQQHTSRDNGGSTSVRFSPPQQQVESESHSPEGRTSWHFDSPPSRRLSANHASEAPAPRDPLQMLEEWHARSGMMSPGSSRFATSRAPGTGRYTPSAHEIISAAETFRTSGATTPSTTTRTLDPNTARSMFSAVTSPETGRIGTHRTGAGGGGSGGLISTPTGRRMREAFEAPFSPGSIAAVQSPGMLHLRTLLSQLSDLEYRKVMDHWMSSQILLSRTVPSPFMGGNNHNRGVPVELMHSTVLSSYLQLHPWSHAPTLMLSTLFRFLQPQDLLLGCRPACKAWHMHLTSNSPQQQHNKWTKKQVVCIKQKVTNLTLLDIMSSLAPVRSFSLHMHRDSVVRWDSFLRQLSKLLPSLCSLSLTNARGLNPVDIADNLSPLFGTLTSISFHRCIHLDSTMLHALKTTLPGLAEFAVESLSPLTASRQTGLHLLATIPLLTSLSLAPLSSDACLAHVLPLTRLQQLHLRGCVTDTGIQSLCVLAELRKLTVECVYQVVQPFGSPSSGSISNGKLAPTSPSATASLLPLDELSGICDGSGFHALDNLPDLRDLTVIIPSLSLHGIRSICSLVRLQKLKFGTSFPESYDLGDLGHVSSLSQAATILALLSSLPLTSLDLSACPWLQDEQISYLTHPLVCQRLISLSLRGLNCLTDVSAYWVSKLVALRELDVRDSGFTHRGVREIRTRNKHLAVLWMPNEPRESAQIRPVKEHVEAKSSPQANSVDTSLDVSGSPEVAHESVETAEVSIQTDEVQVDPALVAVAEPPAKDAVDHADAATCTSADDDSSSTTNLSLTAAFYLQRNTHNSQTQTDDEVANAYHATIAAAHEAAQQAIEQQRQAEHEAAVSRDVARASEILAKLTESMNRAARTTPAKAVTSLSSNGAALSPSDLDDSVVSNQSTSANSVIASLSAQLAAAAQTRSPITQTQLESPTSTSSIDDVRTRPTPISSPPLRSRAKLSPVLSPLAMDSSVKEAEEKDDDSHTTYSQPINTNAGLEIALNRSRGE